MSVREWPTYLLWNLPQPLRDAISQEAQQHDLSVAEVVRRILCERYRMDCPPVTLRKGGKIGYDPDQDLGRPTILLRVHPDLFKRLKAHAARFRTNKRSMRSLIIEALEDHYERRAA